MTGLKVGIIGSGYVGLVTGACLAHLGHDVLCVDNDPKKLAALRKGQVPIYEPGLAEMISGCKKKKKLAFTSSIAEAVRHSEVIFICVNTPPRDDGGADLSYVENVSREIARNLRQYCLVVEKSTVPVQTGERVFKTIRENHRRKVDFDVASNPEFLREGSAISDFLHPDRIVIGVSSKRAEDILRKLYAPIKAPLVVTDIKSAEIIKHASNSFLAAKISFINMVARICDAAGADVEQVAKGMGLDPRIGASFLKAGIGFGGFCFPKDLAAFYHMSKLLGAPFHLLKEVLEINEGQKQYFLQLIERVLWNLRGKTIAILGLAFKGDTDDMRFAPSIDIIASLQKEGVRIRAYDPQASAKAKGILKKVTFVKSAYAACQDADAVAVLTDWKEFKTLDLKKIRKLLKQPIMFDGRNIFDPEQMRASGFDYYGIGRNSKV
ncbi:MAG: UDP-glucose/GDP-mannose dehydrogenase family protein [Candidatus Omnitrophica bacterium]|nr:UDP-glucose/GDP-mannose dehydrogenase family protein [Candidatus Omnitrophota bacterium]